jgi:hypothetical protein
MNKYIYHRSSNLTKSTVLLKQAKTKMEFIMKKGLFSKVWLISLVLCSGHLLAETHTSHQALRVSKRVIERPAVMPIGIINIDSKLQWNDFNTLGVSASSQFGVLRHMEGYFNYNGFDLYASNDKAFKAEIGAKYNYFNIAHTSFSAKASLPVRVSGGIINRDIALGFPITLYNNKMAGGFLDRLVTITMKPTVNVALEFPIWFGIQAYRDLWLQVDISLAKLSLTKQAGKDSSWVSKGFWEELPISVSGTYGLTNRFDIGANFGFSNLLKPKDSFELGATLSARLGRLYE